MADPFLEFRTVSFHAGGRAILDRLDLRVAQGEVLVLLGRSGSGKTTALKLANALLMPSGGEVMVEGRSTRQWNAIELRRRTGYVIQETGLLPHLTVGENVGLVPRIRGAEANPERIRGLLDLVGLPAEFAGRYPRQLSGGQRQRAGVARALAADPRLLLFDEPFGALDPVTRFELQNEFRALQQRLRKTAIFVTHDLREALRLGDRIALLHNGRLEVNCAAAEFRHAATPEASAFLAAFRGDI
ncbi:MAG: ATP-binding cassette domain-containing protein [Bryobacteraceae bacterium]|nr:ATP-binding cassette domain-containing protein [Bryobacteraceae bacterium]